MRPPNKSRSRNKSNRRNNNSGGNVLNRVYDSAGPDGRVRGTPIQVIEKYQALAHDHSLAGDRVAMENFQQHAEHYIRLINEAQRQMAERREQQAEHQNRAPGQDSNGANGQSNSGRNNGNGSAEPEFTAAPEAARTAEQPDQVAEAVQPPAGPEDAGGLVATPEDEASKPKPAKTRRPRRPKAAVAEKPTEESQQAE